MFAALKHVCDTRSACFPQNTNVKGLYYEQPDPQRFVQCDHLGNCDDMPREASLAVLRHSRSRGSKMAATRLRATVLMLVVIYVVFVNGKGDLTRQDGWTDGFDCAEYNPCSLGNIVASGVYFPTADPATYIQCGPDDACYVMNCPVPSTWDHAARSCN
ncbi:hypothetical protein LSAT2_023408 [Lamellibrachia satsuma]|nr:hypothetical protein LSAT2_023408 [Lamellibrachia satsuma]